MAASWQEEPELKDLDEEELWELIEKHRCKIVRSLCPERLTPYLRQAKVLDALDEEEVLHCAKFTNRAMRLGHLLDLLRNRGKNGGIAFLDSLILVNPRIYTLITGKEPSMDLNSFSNLIDSSQLSVFLMHALGGLQEELVQEKQLKAALVHHLRKMREKQRKLEEEGESVRSMEQDKQRLGREMAAQSEMLSKLKDELYELSMRYTHALQEKDAMHTRGSELQEQFYALKEELQRARAELQAAQGGSSRTLCEEQLLVLREENRRLREELMGQDKLGREGEKQDLQNTQELLNQLHCAREKAAADEGLKKLWQEEKGTLVQDNHSLRADSDILRKKMEAFHSQVSELQKERDQAYRARDMVQTEISSVLSEKDSLRQQVMELNDRTSELCQQIRKLEIQLQTQQMRRSFQDLSVQKPSCARVKQRLVRMRAILPVDDGDRSMSESWQELSSQTSSDLGENFQSCPSLQEDEMTSTFSISSSQDLQEVDLLQGERGEETDSEFELVYKEREERSTKNLQPHLPEPPTMSCRESCETGAGCTESPAPRRRYARRMLRWVTIIAFQGDDLMKQISIIGGNMTGIFIHQVTQGSAADEMSLTPGNQIMAVDFDVMNPSYKVSLEGLTSEDAHCTLNRVSGFCCLSVRCNMDEYRKLLSDMESGSVSSGDSFYVRVNHSMAGRVGGGLQVTCNEILHVTDTMFGGRCQWYAYRVNAYSMKDGESGVIPNYPQAQQQLIISIQQMTWQSATPRRLFSEPKKQVRIVSTDRCSAHLLWTSLDCGICDSSRCEEPPAGAALGKRCFTLTPYTLVTHHKIVTLRPVLLVPSLLGRILSEKLCATKDFLKCDTECLTDAEYAALYQRGDIIGKKDRDGVRCCFTRQNVESVAQQNAHCLLELGLSCVFALIRVGIYPIILHIPLTDKSTKKLKKPLQWWRNCEDLLLECAQREEVELDTLPCLHRTVYPDSWSDTESLLCSVRDAIMDEQKRIVWLEKKPC